MKRLFSYETIKRGLASAKAHKARTLVIIIVLIALSNWAAGAFKTDTTETRYVTQAVSRGTLISSVSASGQVSASDQIDVKPKVAGDITWVGVKVGDVVSAGQAIATIDATDAQQNILDAEQSLEQKKLQYQKDFAQAPIDYEKLVEELEDAKKDLATTYSDTFTTVSDAYLALPAVMTGTQNVLYGYTFSTNKSQWNIDYIRNIFTEEAEDKTVETLADIAVRDYNIAREKYDASLAEYKKLTRYSDTDDLEVSLDDSVDTTTAIAQALQSALNLFDTVTDYAEQRNQTLSSSFGTLRTNAQSYLSTTNSQLSSLLSQQKSLDSIKKTIRDDGRSIEIYKIGNPEGDNPISLQSSAQSIANDERNLAELKADLADYTIRAPFTGTIATLDVKKFDSVTTGTSVTTLVAKQQMAEFSLNEIDIVKVKLGQKATVTFDAVPDLTLTGTVVEVDPVATVSQGVVTYDITVAFDTQDERVKPGMSMSVSIITEAKPDVLIVPSSAIKYQGQNAFVQILGADGTPTNKQVEVGSSNDTQTEVVSGLDESDEIITQTISASATQTTQTTQSNSLFPTGGGFGGTTRISR